MAITGYITDTEKIPKDILSTTMDIMNELKCDDIYTESTAETTARPRLKYIMEEVRTGDTLVFHKLSNALSNAVELGNLFRLCHNKKIRLISILDRIDTQLEEYKMSPQDLLLFFSSFSEEAYQSKHRNKKLQELPESAKAIEMQRKKDETDISIINMYMAEYSYDDIKKNLGVKSNRTIVKALKRHGINTCRQKYKCS